MQGPLLHFLRDVQHVYHSLLGHYQDMVIMPNHRQLNLYRYNDGRSMPPDLVIWLKHHCQGQTVMEQVGIFLQAEDTATASWITELYEETPKANPDATSTCRMQLLQLQPGQSTEQWRQALRKILPYWPLP